MAITAKESRKEYFRRKETHRRMTVPSHVADVESRAESAPKRPLPGQREQRMVKDFPAASHANRSSRPSPQFPSSRQGPTDSQHPGGKRPIGGQEQQQSLGALSLEPPRLPSTVRAGYNHSPQAARTAMSVNLTSSAANTASPAAMESHVLFDSACHRKRSHRAASIIKGERTSLLMLKKTVLGKKAISAGTARPQKRNRPDRIHKPRRSADIQRDV